MDDVKKLEEHLKQRKERQLKLKETHENKLKYQGTFTLTVLFLLVLNSIYLYQKKEKTNT